MSESAKVLLVGSIARPDHGWSVEEVFRHSATELRGYVSMLPDGELGDRSMWVTWLPRKVYSRHPDVVTTSRHTYEDWVPRGYDDTWKVTVREGVDALTFPTVGYAATAKASYEVFRRLRDEGVIPSGVRFLVALPLTESAVRAFVSTARDYELLWRGYNDAISRELEELANVIPHQDLAIQWDLARETAAVEGAASGFSDLELERVPSDPMERYLRALEEVAAGIPGDVQLGLHVCYGSLGHKEGESPDAAHLVPLRDLGTAVEMLNRGARACRRRVDYVHMPVQLSDKRDAFYAPLDRLDVGEARVFIGLVDPSDGVEGALERVELARKHLSDFGVATPCGWGRRPSSETPDSLLRLNREVAERL
jgi:methionine synthase II (cobalamin-independent)